MLLSTNSDHEMAEGCNNNLSEEHVLNIAEILKSTFDSQMTSMVSSIVSGALGGLEQKVATLEGKNKAVHDCVSQLEKRVANLENQGDRSNQYSRRNSLRVSGMNEDAGESVDDLVTTLFTERQLGRNR